MIKISNYQTQIKCIRLTLTRKHREQNAYGYGSWRKHIKKIIDLWSISFKLVDFTLRNCTRVQPYVFTTLSGLFSHQSLKIWLSNKISSLFKERYICITCTFSVRVFVSSCMIQIRDCVNESLLLILFMNFFGNSLIDMN